MHISLSMESDGEPYQFKAGDVVRFKVFGKKDCANVVLQKDFPVVSASDTVEIFLSEVDTKIGEVINKHTDYWYEVELNPETKTQTIIGYDEDGAKIFRLFPEGRNSSIDNPDVTPEDVSIMDNKLDLTSKRPVENRVIATAVATLDGKVDDLESTVKKNKQEITEKIDGVADEIEKSIDDLETTVGENKKELTAKINGAEDRLEKSVDDLESTVQETTQRLTDLVVDKGAEITAVREDLTALEGENTAKHNELTEQIGIALNVCTEVNAKHNELSGKHDELVTLHADLEKRMASVETTNEVQDAYLSDVGSLASAVANRVSKQKQTLWEGEWSSGFIFFDEQPDDYMLFKIVLDGQGTSILAVRNGDCVRGIGGYSSATPTIVTYHFAATIYNNQWTMIACNSGNPFENGTITPHTVTSIIGII